MTDRGQHVPLPPVVPFPSAVLLPPPSPHYHCNKLGEGKTAAHRPTGLMYPVSGGKLDWPPLRRPPRASLDGESVSPVKFWRSTRPQSLPALPKPRSFVRSGRQIGVVASH